METITRRHKPENNSDSHKDDIDERIRLLWNTEVDDPNITHGKALHQLPSWFDIEKFRRGQKFFNDNYYALFVSKLCGLLVILSIPRVLNILIMTQKSSTPFSAFKRYLSTLLHMLHWYKGDIMDKDSEAYRSLVEVHAKHMAANRRGLSEKIGSLSQSSMAITQFGFVGFGILMPEKLGIKISDPKDVEGFVHFWRAIGYMIGVEDRYNICNGTVEETRMLCKKILEEILWPYLKYPSEEFKDMTAALLKGMWVMVPFLDVDGFTAFVYDLSGLEFPHLTDMWSRMIFNFQKFVHMSLLRSKIFGMIFRPLLNSIMRFTVFIAPKLNILGFVCFGKEYLS